MPEKQDMFFWLRKEMRYGDKFLLKGMKSNFISTKTFNYLRIGRKKIKDKLWTKIWEKRKREGILSNQVD